jgi:hypothetical protein
MPNSQNSNNLVPEIDPIDFTIVDNRIIDWYLFFDLYQVGRDIIGLTGENNIIILIGDTPSYLTPFLEKNRETFNFAFSSKPFGCFHPPYGNFIKATLHVYTPSKTQLTNYFTYLDTHTKLTRTFVATNWKNIVLVDSSSGQSIIGVSIFFNRYVENISPENDDIQCNNIMGAKPLQFINLSDGLSKTINISPKSAKKYLPDRQMINYDPKLIIFIGSSIFFHRQLFLIYESYPRLVPFYHIREWNNPPEMEENGLQVLNKLRTMLDIYLGVKKKEINVLDLKFICSIYPNYKSVNGNQIELLNKFFNNINLKLLSEKYIYYFT